MMKTCRLLLLMAIASAMLTGQALAGDDDGGAKRNAKIEVTNDFGDVIGVIVDADPDDLDDIAGLPVAEQEDAFEDLGGVILAPGATAVFTGLKAGSHDVFAVDVFDLTSNDTLSVDLDKGETREVTVVDAGGGNVEIDP